MAAWGEDPVRDESREEWLVLLLPPDAPEARTRCSRLPLDRGLDEDEDRKPVECGR
jgi:hypothetical protein